MLCLIPGDDRSVMGFRPAGNAAQSRRCDAAALRRTDSLSNHFALLPRSHQGPFSVLVGCSTLFISAPGSYLPSPGSRTKALYFLIPTHPPYSTLSHPPKKSVDKIEGFYSLGLFISFHQSVSTAFSHPSLF